MWENEIIVLITSLKKRILADKKKARFGRIAADNAIPPFIKSLFEGQVDQFLLDEKPIVVQSTPHFCLNEQDLSHLTGRFMEAFRDSAAFSIEEVEETLRTALVLRMDYLVKPIDTMRRLLFNGETTANQQKIERKLTPFRKLLPYADQLMQECKRLNYVEIEADEYGKLVNDLLQRIVEPDPVKLVLHDFSVLTEFLSETKGEDVQIVEGPLVQEFIADRSLWGFRRAVEVEMKLGKAEFNRVDLEMTIKRYLELKADFSKESTSISVETLKESLHEKSKIESFDLKEQEPEEEKELDPKDDVEPVEFKEAPESDTELHFDEDVSADDEIETFEPDEALIDFNEIIEPQPGIDNKPQPEEDEESWDLEDVLGETESPGPAETPTLKEEKPANKQMRIIRREQRQENEREDEKPSPTFGLKKMIDKKTEKVFTKKLFGNDEAAYSQLIGKLEESESWRVAKILIDNELFKRDVDPFSREAIKLVDLVYSRYYPEEGVGGL